MHQKYENFFLKIFVLCVVFFPFLLSCSEDLSTSEEKVESNIEENQDDVPPFVLEIIPSDGAVKIELDTAIEIKFSEEINISKISINGGVHSCSGTIQVSNDNFTTCVELKSFENHNHENQNLIIRAKDNFSSLTHYKVRVLSDIEDLVGNKMINSVAHKVGFQTGDYLPPVITIVQKIDNHTNDSSPNFIINSNENGVISSLKKCGVEEQNISEGENVINLSELEDGFYDQCNLKIFDNSNNYFQFKIPNFVIDTKIPSIAIVDFNELINKKNLKILIYSNEPVVLLFGGDCQEFPDWNLKENINEINLSNLDEGSYDNCKLWVEDFSKNKSDVHVISFIVDLEKPKIEEITSIVSPNNNKKPVYTFSSTEAGNVVYHGSCLSQINEVVSGINKIQFGPLNDGLYNDCMINVIDKASNISDDLSISPFLIDTISPELVGLTKFYHFQESFPKLEISANETGKIIFDGACDTINENFVKGENVINLNFMEDGSYDDCSIKLIDEAGNISEIHQLEKITIETDPYILNASPKDNDTFISVDSEIIITFSEPIDIQSVSVNYDNGSCYGNVLLTENNFDECIPFSSLYTRFSDGNRKLHLSPKYNLNHSTVHKFNISSIKDMLGNKMDEVFSLSFTTVLVDAPQLKLLKSVKTPTNNNSPSFVFDSDESGEITYYGSCSSETISVNKGENIIYLNKLEEGEYLDCFISVKNNDNHSSNKMKINDFKIDLTKPKIVSTFPFNGFQDLKNNPDISIKFNEMMDLKTIYTNSLNGECSGSILLSSDNFSTCIALNDPKSEDRMEFKIEPESFLENAARYKLKISSEINDEAGNTSDNETIINFRTEPGKFIRHYGTPGNDVTNSIAIDSEKNIILVGHVEGILEYSNCDENLLRASSYDGIIIKIKKNGICDWIRQIGSTGNSEKLDDKIFDVAIDGQKNIYITGYTTGNLAKESDNKDVFIAKYDKNGNKLWLDQFGSEDDDSGKSININIENEIIVGGSTNGILGDKNYGKKDLFIVKYDVLGFKKKINQYGTSGDDEFKDFDINSSGDILIVGETYGKFENFENSGSHDIFLYSLNNNGEKNWIRQFGSSEADSVGAIETDSNDNIFLVGSTYGNLFDNESKNGLTNYYLTKLDKNGSLQWSKDSEYASGSFYRSTGEKVVVGTENDIYIIGGTYNDLHDLKNIGYQSGFIIKYSNSGDRLWGKIFGTDSYDIFYAIAKDLDENLYVTGTSQGAMTNLFENLGGDDIILLRYDSHGVLQ